MTTELDQSTPQSVIEKRMRGRPAVMDYQLLKRIYVDSVTTRRSLLNKYYENTALGIIEELQQNGETGLEYLVDARDFSKPKAKWGILRELGKFPERDIPDLARFVCNHAGDKNPVKKWEAILRKVRLSETVSENPDDEDDESDSQ
jgi:hypothetical protein